MKKEDLIFDLSGSDQYQQAYLAYLDPITKEVILLTYSNGMESWWKDNKRHREDGPAFRTSSGELEWYIDGEHICCKS